MSENASAPMAPSMTESAPFSQWYASAMVQLVEVVQQLSQARSLEAIVEIVRKKARQLTGADGATFVLRDGECCYYYEEDAISPLWKGQRFPLTSCISGWAMLNREAAVIEDIYSDARIPADAYRPTFVKSLAMVPIRRQAPLGAIGNYWATTRQPTREEVMILQALADTVSVAFENAQLYGELKQQVLQLQAQQRRIQEQRDSLEVFTRALAHDLKEPVRSVLAFSSMIDQGKASPAKLPTYLGFIRKASQRMHLLVESVFDYLQLEGKQGLSQEPCDLNALLQSALSELQPLLAARQVRITAGDLPTVSGQSGLLKSLFQQLIVNAVEHGGQATDLAIEIKATALAEAWQLEVSDSGQGIEAEYLEKIFQPFQRLQAQAEHAGLGLPASRKIVGMHGGRMWCESTPGQGSRFCFTLPGPALTRTAVAGEAGPAADAVQPQNQTLRPLANLLLVDDDESDIELARLALIDEIGLECNLRIAQSGKHALQMLRESQDKGEKIDLMLLDINMPGMNGFDVLQEIRRDCSLKDLQVIVCTGSSHDKDRKSATELGSVGYLLKPPEFELFRPLLDRIKSLELRSLEAGQHQLLRVSS